MGEKFFIGISNSPKMIVVFFSLLTLIFATFIGKTLFTEKGVLILDNSLKPLFDQGPGAYQFYASMEKEFGSDQNIFIALHPEKEFLSDLSLFLFLDEFSKKLEQGVPDVTEVISLTSTVRTSGACIGKTWFHIETIGSVCENVLDRYRDRLNCMENPEVEISLPSPRLDLLSNFEETLEDPFQESLESTGSRDESIQPGFVCTPEIHNLSQQQLWEITEREVKEIFMELADQPLVLGDFLSEDFQTFGLVVRFKEQAIPASIITQNSIERLLRDAETQGYQMAFAGQPRNEFEASKVLRYDIVRIFPVSILIMLLVLWASFRNFLGVLIPLIIVITGVIWTVGIFGMMGKTLNLLTLILPSLIIAVGTAYVIHFMASYFQAAKHENLNSTEIVDKTIGRMVLPLSVTGLTTVVGFLALTISPIPAIRDFGLFACIGITIITFLVLSLGASILKLVPSPKQGSAVLKRGMLDIWMTSIGFHVSNHSKSILIGWVLIGVIASVGLPFLVVESKTKNFHSKSSVVLDKEYVEKQLGGVNYLRIVFSNSEKPEVLQSAETMNRIVKFKDWLEEDSHRISGINFHKLYSPLDFLEIERGGLDQLKDSEVRSYFNKSDKDVPIRFLSNNLDQLQLTLRLSIENTRDFLKFKDLVDIQLQQLFPELEIRYTGSAMLASQSSKSITEGQIYSLAIAVTLIFVVLSILFVSVKIGFLALLPNLLAILVFFGFLGWFSIPIGVTISVIAAVSLGIGVDDAIHFVTHYNRNIKRFKSEKEAMQQTLRQVGKPMIYTTAAITLGFIVFAFSRMDSQVLFGIMTAFTLSVCLATDLHLLPSILVRVPIVTLWDYLQLHYPKEVVDNIGLFEGLSVRESKIVILMMQTRDIKTGEIIYRENDPVRDLFILLSGSVEIYIEKKYHGHEEIISELQQGRSFGALALFPLGRRMTSAKAKTSTRLLILNQAYLHRLKNRYPVIASKIFVNLAKNLEESIKNRYYRKLVSMIENLAQKEVEQKLPAGLLNRIIMETARIVPEKQKEKFQLFSRKWLFPLVRLKGGVLPIVKKKSPLLDFVDQIIASRTTNYRNKLELKELIHNTEKLTVEEKVQLDLLKRMILEGKVVELKPDFANIFHNMTEADIAWLKENNEIQNIPADTRVFSQGDYGDFMLALLSGKLCTQMEINDKKVPVLTITPGDIVGARAILCHDTNRYVTAKALENSQVIRITLESFENMIQQNKKLSALFTYNLVGMLSHRLRRNVSTLYG